MFGWMNSQQLASWLTFANYATIVLSAVLLVVAIGKQNLSNEKDKRAGLDKIAMQQRIEAAANIANKSVGQLAENRERLAESERKLIQAEKDLKITAQDATEALNLYKQTKGNLEAVNARMMAIATLQLEFELYSKVPIPIPDSYVDLILRSSMDLGNYPSKGRGTYVYFEGHSAVATPATLPYGPAGVQCTNYHFVLDYANTMTGPDRDNSFSIIGKDVSVLNNMSMFHMDVPSLKKVLDPQNQHEFVDMRVKLLVNGHPITLFALQNNNGEVLEQGSNWRITSWKKKMQDLYLSFDQ